MVKTDERRMNAQVKEQPEFARAAKLVVTAAEMATAAVYVEYIE